MPIFNIDHDKYTSFSLIDEEENEMGGKESREYVWDEWNDYATVSATPLIYLA